MQISAAKKEHRLQFRFWLDVFRPEEDQLAEYVSDLKEKRHFAQTIRDALHLIRDLRNGRVEMLLKLFPWIEDHFAKPITQPVPLALPDPLREHMERVERYFNQLPVPSQKMPLLLNEPPMPDDEPTIQMERVSSGKEGWNALISIAALNGSFDELPPEIVAYGLEIGRIPANTVKKVEHGPKKMEVPQFATPDFDDDEPLDLIRPS